MAKKKLSSVMAWTLTAAMAVNPVTAVQAAEVSETETSQTMESFTEGSQADAEDAYEDQQINMSDGDIETSEELTAPESEASEFSDESNSVEVFSAGATDEETLTITREGTYDVNPDKDFLFQPEETGTYKFSVESEKGLKYGNYVRTKYDPETGDSWSGEAGALKCENNQTYTMHVSLATNDDVDWQNDKVRLKIEKIPSIKEITVNSSVKDNGIYTLENMNSFITWPSLKFTLDNVTDFEVRGEECGD